MISIDPAALDNVIRILRQHLSTDSSADESDVAVYAFGSRTKSTARPYSDLDLILKSKHKISLQLLDQLKNDFEESDLPFRVDLSDWHRVSETFKSCIEEGMVKINLQDDSAP